MVYITDAKILQKRWSQFKILCARRGEMKQVSDEDPHVLEAIVQNFDATTTWRTGYVHFWFIPQTISCSVFWYSPFKDRSAVQKTVASNGTMIVNDKLKLAWMKKEILFRNLPGSKESCRDSKLCLKVTVRSVST